MKPVTKELLERLIAEMARRLYGEWVIIGGAVLPLVGIEHRVTYDIDLAGPQDATQMLELLEIAASLGLPIEAINQAAAFFLHRIEDWHEHLIPVCRTERFSLFRPDATLYVLMKLSRLSESDLEDCLKYLAFSKSRREPFDPARLSKAIRQELLKKGLEARQSRMKALLKAIRIESS